MDENTVLNGKTVKEWIACGCVFCSSGRSHEGKHTNAGTYPVSGRLTKAESLDKSDRIYVEACNICGHSSMSPNNQPN